ncbi:MAG TPA: membrane dipeptidase [Vicinamibacteria bacterium]|nr:membrane dipeptidase [Vicinamibacteria bacterium]
MGIHRNTASYRSYQYLKADRGFRDFDLVEGHGPFEPYLLPLTVEEERRTLELAERLVIISLHEHPHLFPKDIRQCRAYDREGRTVTAYEALADSYWDALFDNFQDGTAIITSKSGWKWTDVIFDVGMRLCDLAHQDFVIRCETVDDIHRAHDEGRIALIPAQEGAAMIENELDRIEILYGIGIRAMGITYSESNALGTGLKEPGDGGLTAFGRRAVRRMNDVGMAIDCAHASPQTTLDTIETSTKPIFLSHTGARSLWNIKRLAPDEVLEACAGKGGVIGIEAAPHTTMTRSRPGHDLESYMEHFEYVKELVGIDHVAFGPDTLYGDHVGLHHVYTDALSIDASHEGGAPSYEEVAYVKGVENPTEASKNILRWLVKHGYSDEDIAKALGGNALRVLADVWQ